MKTKNTTLLIFCMFMSGARAMQQAVLTQSEYSDEFLAIEYMEKAQAESNKQKPKYHIARLWTKRALARKKISPELSSYLHLLLAETCMRLPCIATDMETDVEHYQITDELMQALQYCIKNSSDSVEIANAQFKLATVYFEGLQGVSKDFKKATDILKPLAQKTCSKSLFRKRKQRMYEMLAEIYEDGGYGVEKDERRALSYVFEAAQLITPDKKN